MFVRMAFVAVFALLSSGLAAIGEEATRSPENTAAGPTPGDICNAGATAECSIEIGRYYLSRGNQLSAINRFKVVVTRFPSSPVVDEALFRLVKAYLMLGIRNEAQTASIAGSRTVIGAPTRSTC